MKPSDLSFSKILGADEPVAAAGYDPLAPSHHCMIVSEWVNAGSFYKFFEQSIRNRPPPAS